MIAGLHLAFDFGDGEGVRDRPGKSAMDEAGVSIKRLEKFGALGTITGTIVSGNIGGCTGVTTGIG